MLRQGDFNFSEPRTHGGRRKGAGRPKRKSGVAHATRERVSRHDPRIVTIKLAEGLPWLRESLEARALTYCIREAQRPDFRIVHYSIQRDHVHFTVEADSKNALSNGMKGLNSRIARTLNMIWRRTGRVFRECFHDRVLKTLREVRNALVYVLNNHLKHGTLYDPCGMTGEPDVFSSGRFFDGWAGRPPDSEAGSDGAIVVRGGWKLSCGWKRRYRAITLDAAPRSGAAA
ncbi:MAG: transposase [Planctomycetes bacterium]|nr:transposase [Planctomycetota bacterium]MCB9904693.1 transposase [Planctomycetota bacterium]